MVKVPRLSNVSSVAENAGRGVSTASLAVSRLTSLVDMWVLAGDIAQHSARTTESRKERMRLFGWWVAEEGLTHIGRTEIMRFLAYLRHGHEGETGRFGLNTVTARRPLSSGRVVTFFSTLRAFFNWCVREGELSESPMERIDTPIDRPDQVQPFTDEQLKALKDAAVRTRKGRGRMVDAAERRDEALFFVLLDTGMRASELCSLTVGDVDLPSMEIRIQEGKGGKARTVPIQKTTRQALYYYLRGQSAEGLNAPLFPSARGSGVGDFLTRRGLALIVARWGKSAKVSRARCSPHTFRHTFAINYLRNGGDIFTLKTILGHTSLKMVNQYLQIANADMARQHATSSPVENLFGKGGKPRR